MPVNQSCTWLRCGAEYRPPGQDPRPAALCPAPTAAGYSEDDQGHPFGLPDGLASSRTDIRTAPHQPVRAAVTSHPGIVAQTARVCQTLEGLSR